MIIDFNFFTNNSRQFSVITHEIRLVSFARKQWDFWSVSLMSNVYFSWNRFLALKKKGSLKQWTSTSEVKSVFCFCLSYKMMKGPVILLNLSCFERVVIIMVYFRWIPSLELTLKSWNKLSINWSEETYC